MTEINFPNIQDIANTVLIFEGDAPNDINTNTAFAPGVAVGLFVSSSNPSGSEWGLITGGTLTASAQISVFEKTSDLNNGIMRIKPTAGDLVWASLTGNGQTGWSIRTSVGKYYGFVEETYPTNAGIEISLCSSLSSIENPRILIGPTGQDNIYLLYECDNNSLTASAASIDEKFVDLTISNTGEFLVYECISTGTNNVTPATFTGPIQSSSTYFTSYTPLTGGAECGYPYIWNWGDKLQDWKYDCGASGWIGEGSTITSGPEGGQGSQGFQGFIGNDAPTTSRGPQGFQGFQGTQGFQGNIGRQGRQGFQGFLGGTGTVNVAGNDGEIQYKQGTGLSANSLAKIVSDPNLDPNSGYSGNFANYSESIRIDTGTYSSGGTINLNFDAYNVYRATQIELSSDKTLTFSGFNTSRTGQSLTLVLGYSGGSNSQIVIPGQENIYWKNGPLGGGGGETSYIEPTSTRQNTVFYFLDDGDRIYGSYSTDYRKA